MLSSLRHNLSRKVMPSCQECVLSGRSLHSTVLLVMYCQAVWVGGVPLSFIKHGKRKESRTHPNHPTCTLRDRYPPSSQSIIAHLLSASSAASPLLHTASTFRRCGTNQSQQRKRNHNHHHHQTSYRSPSQKSHPETKGAGGPCLESTARQNYSRRYAGCGPRARAVGMSTPGSKELERAN
jgi:hypothetical protein